MLFAAVMDLGGGASNGAQEQDLPLPLAFLLAGLMGNAAGFPGGVGEPGTGSLVFLTSPGGGLVSLSSGGPDGPSPFSILQGLDGMSPPAFAVSNGASQSSRDESGLVDGLTEAMQAMMNNMARVVIERSMEENSVKIPPAKETVRDALPRVVVTKEDLVDSTNSKCSVCLDDYRPGCRATRMLCGHLFCTGCIREWLRTANSCPVCRYELATDDENFEAGRKQRMTGRVARLRAGELRMLRVPELRRLMRALEVSGQNCVEKADMVKELSDAGHVEVVPEDSERLCYEPKELENLELPLLLNLLERHRVPSTREQDDLTEEQERQAAFQGLEDAGWMKNAATPRRDRKMSSVGQSVDSAGAAAKSLAKVPVRPRQPMPDVRSRPSRPSTPAETTGNTAVSSASRARATDNTFSLQAAVSGPSSPAACVASVSVSGPSTPAASANNHSSSVASLSSGVQTTSAVSTSAGVQSTSAATSAGVSSSSSSSVSPGNPSSSAASALASVQSSSAASA